MIRQMNMETTILMSKEFCSMEAIKYVAHRYGVTPEKIIEQYLIQTGIIRNNHDDEPDNILAPNELALFSDLGVQPSKLELQ